jgi:hypothetical protein
LELTVQFCRKKSNLKCQKHLFNGWDPDITAYGGGQVLGKGFVLLTLRLRPHNFDSYIQDIGNEHLVGETEICEVKSSVGGGGQVGHTRGGSATEEENFFS